MAFFKGVVTNLSAEEKSFLHSANIIAGLVPNVSV